MPLNIEVRDEHVKEMIEFYIEKQRNLKSQVFQFEKQIKEITAIIQQLNQSMRESVGEIKPLPDASIYSEKWTWVRKIKFAIEQSGKPITTREVVELLSQYEPEIMYNRKKAVASVSSTLSVKTGDDFLKVESESGENAYYLPTESIENINEDQYGIKIELGDLPF
jgi:hypothetical protein